MELRHLRQFVTIAETGSYRRAAEILFIAQPALSVSIKKLEHEVGAQLFIRSAKGAELTVVGRALLEDARRTLFHAEQALLTVRLVAHGELGKLRLGFVGSATYHLLPQTIPAFRARYPNIEVSLLEDSTEGLLTSLRTNHIDAALVRGPLAADPYLDSWVIEQDSFVLAVNQAHPFAQHKTISLKACQADPFIMYSPKQVPALNRVALGLCTKAGFAPHIYQEAVQVQTLISLVASGLGVALVPGVSQTYSNPHVRFLTLTDPDAQAAISLSLVTHKNTTCAPVQRLLESFKL